MEYKRNEPRPEAAQSYTFGFVVFGILPMSGIPLADKLVRLTRDSTHTATRSTQPLNMGRGTKLF
jgi:hypothetical protein